MSEKPYLKVADVMAITGRSRNNIYTLIRRGKLKAVTFGERGYLITPEDLLQALGKAAGEQKW
jgi:excisionase family DNA binding protein